jgi:hypothetical protein
MTADLALAADPGFLERSADPAEFVIQACERAKVWLREVLDHGDIEQIVEVKSQADAIRVYSMQKQLGKDAELSAREIVLRAERGIHFAIEYARKRDEVLKPGQTLRRPGHHLVDNQVVKKSLSDLGVNLHELGNTRELARASAEDFECALADAKAEGDLHRANVIRKVHDRQAGKADPANWVPAADDRSVAGSTRRRELIRDYAERGYSSRQMEEMLGTQAVTIRQIAREMGIGIAADAVIKGTHAHDSSRIVRETVHALEGLVMGIELVDLGQLDPAEASEWAASLTTSTRTLSRFLRQLKEAAQ